MAKRNRCCRRAAAIVALMCLGTAAMALVGCAGRQKEPSETAPTALTAAERQLYARAEGRLTASDSAVREQAAVALLSMEHPAGLRAVLDVMRNAEDPAVRASMVRAAAFLEDHRCFHAVLSAIEDPSPTVQEAAAEALARFTRPQEIEAVTDFIRSPESDARRRRLLYDALGEGLAVSAVPVLIEGLRSTDEQSRQAALGALRRIADRDLAADVGAWQEWWEANSGKTREAVLEEHLRDASGELTDYKSRMQDVEAQHEELMDLVGEPEGQNVELLLRSLQSRHPIVRRYAASRLAGLPAERLGTSSLDDREAYAALRNALDDPDASIRRDVMEVTGRLEGEYKDNLVRKALQDEDPEVLVMAIQAASTTAGNEAVDRIETLLQNSPDPDVRVAAAGALGDLGDAESVPALLGAFDDEEENVRWLAVEGLRKLNAVQAVPRISRVLQQDPSPRVRAIAASALGELGQPAGVPSLRQALQDASERVRQKAAAALLQLAVDNYERMIIIAEAFRDRGLLSEARQVLERVPQAFGEVEGMAPQVARARRELAEVMKLQADYTAAAAVYETLLAHGHNPTETRRNLVDCWLKAGKPQQVVDALEEWITPDASDELLDLALEVAEMFVREGNEEEARLVLQAIQEDVGTAGLGTELSTRLQRLQTRLAP